MKLLRKSMRDLIEFLLEGITGGKTFSVEEKSEEGLINYVISAKPGDIGLIIGKGGKTIRAIRNLMKVRATLEKKAINISVNES